MGFILTQTANDDISKEVSIHLLKTGECLFDVTKSGARLQPIIFGSRCCTGQERSYHSLVGESACGHWAISKNGKYLWGTHFYWICDCKAIQEILEYNGEIVMISRWSQELLG